MIEEKLKSSNEKAVSERLIIARKFGVLIQDYLGSGAGNAFKPVFTNYYIINSSY